MTSAAQGVTVVGTGEAPIPKPKKLTADTCIVAVVSDLHAGSTVALCPPRVSLDDGGHYEASRAQRWMWERWDSFWDTVAEQRDRAKADLIFVCNGDAVDGNHHGTTQILSGNPTAQASVVNEVLGVPLSLAPDRMAFTRGTDAHVGPSAAFEERIALGLHKDGRPVIMDAETGTASWWHLNMDIQDRILNFAHHGKIGGRPSTKMTAVYSQAFDIWTEHTMRGERAPDLSVRSHMHRFADSGKAYPTRHIQTPAWQLATSYVNKIAPNTLADIGGIIVTIRDGKMDAQEYLYRPKPQAPWRADK